MKTLKITTILATLNIVLFMSVSSTANTFTLNTGDDNKSVNNESESVKSTLVDVNSTPVLGNEFDYLRFDANNFSDGNTTELTELPLMNQFDYLRFELTNFYNSSDLSEMPLNDFIYMRFDVNDFNINSDLSEMPVNEFSFLRFDVNNYTNASEMSEMPVDDFDYLRFDMNKYSVETTVTIDELPVN